MNGSDKYEAAKAEIMAIYHENKGRYGYRRITMELCRRNTPLNHKTVQRLMKELGLPCQNEEKSFLQGWNRQDRSESFEQGLLCRKALT